MANSEPVVIASDQSAVPVSGTVAVTGALTDAQLRATPVPVSGTVTGGLTDAELRATPVPVSVTGGGDATAANQATEIASLGIIDDWDESDRAKVNPIVGQAGVAGNSGNVGATVQRVVIATDQPALTTAGLISVKIDQTVDGTTNKVRLTATQKPSYGATVVMTVTNLQSLANSATVGWQSARVSNLATLATDYEIMVKLTTANTAPANDKVMYVFICPWYTSDAGTTWFPSSQGTTTLPTGTEGASTIASPNNLRLLGVLNYTTQQMIVQDTFLLSNCFGGRLPDGFSIIIINFSGAALSTACIVDYSPLNDTLA